MGRIVTRPEPVTLLFEENEYPNLELSIDADRCIYFCERGFPSGKSPILFYFLDYRIEMLRHGHFRFAGYVEIDDAPPGEKIYRYATGEFFISHTGLPHFAQN